MSPNSVIIITGFIELAALGFIMFPVKCVYV